MSVQQGRTGAGRGSRSRGGVPVCAGGTGNDMNRPNGRKISTARIGVAKVFDVFPIIPISIGRSVCYRIGRAVREGLFLFLVDLLAAILEPEIRTLPAGRRAAV
jgi:hypothetical protein